MNPRSTYRMPVRLSLALALGIAVGGCAGAIGGSGQPSVAASPAASSAVPVPTPAGIGPFPEHLVQGLHTDVDFAYTEPIDCGGTPCTVPGDVLAPTGGTDLPTIVLLGGGSTPFAERRYQELLAAELAERGAVVFLMSYRSAVTGNYDSASYNDLRCAVRYARVATEEYGGDPSRIVVVGHSQGGLMGLQVAIQPEREAEGCLAEGSGKPDAVVGLGAPSPAFGDAGDDAPPMWLFAGVDDRDAEGTAQRLRDRGYDAQARELPGVTHTGITDPSSAPEVVDLIFEAVDSI